jgi:acyl carrier protein
MDARERVLEMILEMCMVPEDVSDEMTFSEDLAFDSVDIATLVSRVEEEFGLELDLQAIIDANTVGQFMDCVNLAMKSSG